MKWDKGIRQQCKESFNYYKPMSKKRFLVLIKKFIRESRKNNFKPFNP